MCTYMLPLHSKTWQDKDQDAWLNWGNTFLISSRSRKTTGWFYISIMRFKTVWNETNVLQHDGFCPQGALLAFVSLSTLLQFPLLLQLKSMEIKHVEGKQTSIKVSQCVFSSRICFTPQLTVLAVRAWITRTTAVFPPDSGPPLKRRAHLVVSLWVHDKQIDHLNDFLMQPITVFVDASFGPKSLCCHLTFWDWKRQTECHWHLLSFSP